MTIINSKGEIDFKQTRSLNLNIKKPHSSLLDAMGHHLVFATCVIQPEVQMRLINDKSYLKWLFEASSLAYKPTSTTSHINTKRRHSSIDLTLVFLT